MQFLLQFGVVFAFARMRFSEQEIGRLARAWVWVAAAAAFYGVYQAIARLFDLPLAYLPIDAKGFSGMVVKAFFGFYAASSWFAEPSWFASFLLVPFLYVIGALVFDVPHSIGFKRSTALLLTCLLALGLFLSLSQAAYVTLLTVGVPLVWCLRKRLNRTVVISLVVAFAMAAAGVILMPAGSAIVRAQGARLSGLTEAIRTPDLASEITSYAARIESMRAGIEIWRSSPYIGVGINNVRSHPLAPTLSDPESGSVSSGLLQLLVEQGVLGFTVLLGFLCVMWQRLYRARVAASDLGNRFILWFLTWGLVVDVVNSIVTHPWQHPQRWLVIAFAVSYLAYLDARGRVEGITGQSLGASQQAGA
jgi:O-antigen ligase